MQTIHKTGQEMAINMPLLKKKIIKKCCIPFRNFDSSISRNREIGQ